MKSSIYLGNKRAKQNPNQAGKGLSQGGIRGTKARALKSTFLRRAINEKRLADDSVELAINGAEWIAMALSHDSKPNI